MEGIIRIDVSDEAFEREKELLMYRIFSFMMQNDTDENEMISLLVEMKEKNFPHDNIPSPHTF